jgi:hypothetical protein
MTVRSGTHTRVVYVNRKTLISNVLYNHSNSVLQCNIESKRTSLWDAFRETCSPVKKQEEIILLCVDRGQICHLNMTLRYKIINVWNSHEQLSMYSILAPHTCEITFSAMTVIKSHYCKHLQSEGGLCVAVGLLMSHDVMTHLG